LSVRETTGRMLDRKTLEAAAGVVAAAEAAADAQVTA
jgi:hypothetical protein